MEITWSLRNMVTELAAEKLFCVSGPYLYGGPEQSYWFIKSIKKILYRPIGLIRTTIKLSSQNNFS